MPFRKVSGLFYEKYIKTLQTMITIHQLLVKGVEVGDAGISAPNSTESHKHHIAFVLSHALKQVSDDEIF